MTVNEELRRLIPKLKDDEFSSLEKSIIAEGCRDALVTWDGTLIDGHNRYEICTKHGIEFETIEKNFNTLDDVKIWMIENQAGRRNITDYQRYELMQVKAEILRERGRDKQLSTLKQNTDLSLNDKTDTHNTQKAISEGLGWSTGKVAQADVVSKKATEDVKQKLRDGDLSIGAAYKEVRKAERVERNEEIKSKAVQEISDKYRVIYADPPWQYNDKQNIEGLGGAEKHYPTASLDDICAIPVKDWTEENAVLFLWTTSPLLEDTFKVISSWGFKYKTSFVWDKVRHNMGHYNSVRHELLLVCTNGSCTPDNRKLFDSVQEIEKTERHSQKPEEFRNIIDTLYTHGKKLEMFSRTNVEGWEHWGLEA